jgi:hypothetical protein
MIEDDAHELIDVGFVTDVRYENEADWIKRWRGNVVHLSKYTKVSEDGGRTWIRKYQLPPNDEEKYNGPLVKHTSDVKVEWEDLSNGGNIKISPDELSNTMYIREQVFNALQQCPGLSLTTPLHQIPKV